jgi:XTP/dITP diphosphohydrolase
MKLIFATNNRHKLEEVSAILGPWFKLVTPAGLGITEDIPETQPTLEGNALQKARYVYKRITDGGAFCAAESVEAAFADDTGLEVAALNGEPGVRSARYAGDQHDFDENTRLLLKNLEGAADRSARFRTVIALILDGKEYLFEGRADGRIIDEYRGDGGFGYDPVFVPDGCVETFAEMSAGQKNAISHRARAVEKLAEFLHDYETAKRLTTGQESGTTNYEL